MKQIKLPYIIALISLLFLLIKLATINSYANLWWDSAVYISMGKYIFSLGNIGLWEPSRPLIWPILLGLLWALRLNPVIFGRLLTILVSFGIVLLTYFIAEKIGNKKTALLASIFTAFSPTFLFFSSNILSDIPSVFFSLLGIYLLFNKKYFSSGLFFGIAFMTRFLQLFSFIMAVLILAYRLFKKKEELKIFPPLIAGFLIPLVTYLLVNLILYKNPLEPFILQFLLTKNTGWIYFEPFWFYVTNLFKENIFYIFAFFGIYLMYVYKKKHQERKVIAAIFIFYLLFFSLIKHKEMRFVITFLPYMSILAGYGLSHIFVKEKKAYALFFISALFILLSLSQYQTDVFHYHLLPFYDYIDKPEVKDGIWISNPVFLAYSDKIADKLIYDEFNSKRAIKLQKESSKANHILVNTCDFPCPPADKLCKDEKEKLITMIKLDFKEVYSLKFYECELLIYKKIYI